MVLASTPDTTNLEDLVQLADKITKVTAPSIAAMSTLQFTEELERLRAEVAVGTTVGTYTFSNGVSLSHQLTGLIHTTTRDHVQLHLPFVSGKHLWEHTYIATCNEGL